MIIALAQISPGETMVNRMRVHRKWAGGLAAATLLLCIAAPSAFAAPITYTLSGPVSGSLGGTPFVNAQITITAIGDTSNIPALGCSFPVVCNTLSSVTFNINGVGSGTVTDSLFIFDNHNIGPGLGALGLERTVGTDWIDVDDAQFTVYGLATPIGPLPVAAHPGSPFGSVATTAGILALTSNPGTFQAVGGGISPPTIVKAFGAVSVPQGGSTSLTFTITNPNGGTGLTSVGFTDNLPAGLVIATPNGLSGSCGGGTITAVAGSGSATLATATLAASASCNFSVNVTGTSGGVQNNTTGAVTSFETGPGGTASASVTVVTPPTLVKGFGAASIPQGGSTSLSFNVTNPNVGAGATGVGFTDTLPAGLVVATPNGLSGSCGGGTITAVAGSGSVTLAGASLAGSASCNFSVNVTGNTPGLMNNTTGAVTSLEGGTGGTASASVTVSGAGPGQPPTIVPTLQQWALGLLALLILIVAAGATVRARGRP